jgi:hypothetical protein
MPRLRWLATVSVFADRGFSRVAHDYRKRRRNRGYPGRDIRD